jgi:hypothetical protein
MTKEDAAQTAGDEFLRVMKEAAPDNLTSSQIVHICGWLIATYSRDKDEAHMLVALLLRALERYYSWAETLAGPEDTVH